MTRHGTFDRFFALLNQLPGEDKDELKRELVWQYSGMLTESLKELHDRKPNDYKRMLAEMQTQVQKFNPKRFKEQETKRLRSAILHRMQKYGIDTTSWPVVNKFLECPKIAGKRLYNLSIEEMEALIPKLESILKKDFAKREHERELAKNN